MEESLIYPYYMLALHIAEAADEGFVKSPLAKQAAATSGAEACALHVLDSSSKL